MPLIFKRLIIIVAAQGKTAKDPLYFKGISALAYLSGLGLVGFVETVHRLLEQPPNQLIGRPENRRAHQDLQFSHGTGLSGLRLEPDDQLLDFLFLGEPDLGRELFFFEAILWRVSAMTKSAYWRVSSWYWA